MSYRRFSQVAAAFAVAAAVALAGAVHAQQPIVIKFSCAVGVYNDNESRVGKDTIEAVYKQTGFKP
jgi:hypothetical protein